MAFKGAIFDLDGVIVDSVPLHFVAWKHLFEGDFNIHFDMRVYEEHVDGKPRLDSIRDLLPQLSEEEVIKAGEIKQGYYLEELAAGKLVEFEDAFNLIYNLKENGILLAAASSSKNTKRILEQIGLIKEFQTIVTGYDFKHGKPHPEIFLNAAKNLKLDVHECVVFEDSLSGVKAAKAGDFLCVGIDRNNRPENYTLADLHVPNLENVNYQTLEKMFQ
ncbi:MAG: beta-phosphoglucomutase family hydrolase [Gammaproteobacteria bacterium]|nr:beta-phosphoglucomutase family hydrolase [Gammaproteobacteria bacterium]